jgi:hypothetical protein
MEANGGKRRSFSYPDQPYLSHHLCDALTEIKLTFLLYLSPFAAMIETLRGPQKVNTQLTERS